MPVNDVYACTRIYDLIENCNLQRSHPADNSTNNSAKQIDVIFFSLSPCEWFGAHHRMRICTNKKSKTKTIQTKMKFCWFCSVSVVRRLFGRKCLVYLQFSYLHAAVRIVFPCRKTHGARILRRSYVYVRQSVCVQWNNRTVAHSGTGHQTCRQMRETLLAINAVYAGRVNRKQLPKKSESFICGGASRFFSILLFSTIRTYLTYMSSHLYRLHEGY